MKIKNGVNFTKISHSSHPRDYTFKEVKKKNKNKIILHDTHFYCLGLIFEFKSIAVDAAVGKTLNLYSFRFSSI